MFAIIILYAPAIFWFLLLKVIGTPYLMEVLR